MQYHRHVFSPYTLYLANCVELVYAQYPKFLLLKRSNQNFNELKTFSFHRILVIFHNGPDLAVTVHIRLLRYFLKMSSEFVLFLARIFC